MSIPPRGRVVIIGGGPAGAASAVGLRRHGFTGEIVLICAEQHVPYSRPPLSKAFLRGEVDRGDLALDTADAQVRVGIRATAVDVDARTVTLSNGDRLPYDGLVLATGTTARRPAEPSVAVLQTMADAEALAPRLRRARSVIVVGSGLLAFELASATRSHGAETTLVLRPGALRSRYGMLADMIETRADAAGVRLVRTPTGTFHAGGAVTAEGTLLEADLTLAAIGGTNAGALTPAHAPFGIVTDDRCRLRPDVVAAGDAASIRRADGSLRRDATWMNALAHGAAAARSLLDDDAPAFDPVSYGWTEVFGLDIKFAGAPPSTVDDHEITVVDGDLDDNRALLAWPGGAAAIGYRIPVGKLRALATAAPMVASPDPARLSS